MSNLPADQVADGEPKTKKPRYGLKSEYELDGDKVEIHGFVMDDGGVHWIFIRNGHEHPLDLSRKGMNVMLSLWHDLSWAKPETVRQAIENEAKERGESK